MSSNNLVGNNVTGRVSVQTPVLKSTNTSICVQSDTIFDKNVFIQGTLTVNGAINQIQPIFPGDNTSVTPDFVVLGGGCGGLAAAKKLSDDFTKRVLVLEAGNDNTQDPLVFAPFAPAPYRGGETILNAFGVVFDPKISTYNGAPQGAGDALSLYPLWTGTGLGGGNQHYLLDAVRCTQRLVDGPLPANILNPASDTQAAFVQAGGPAWAYSNVNTVTSQLENFQVLTGYGSSVPGLSENIAERGTSGPLSVLQLQPPHTPNTTTSGGGGLPLGTINVASTSGMPGSGFVAILTNANGYQIVNYTGTTPTSITGCSGGTGFFNNAAPVFLGPFDGGLLIQMAFSNAALTVPGGAACPLVLDYNCNTSFADGESQLNCVSQNQNFLTNVFTREGAQTAYLKPSIVQSDGNGNYVGVGGRKLIVLTKCRAVNAVKDASKSTTSYVASGVQFLQGNVMKFVAAKNLVNCMGAGYAPRFWEMSGLGPSAVLSDLGIQAQANSPGLEHIGNNLHNQYGPLLSAVTTNPYFAGVQFPGQSFVQYNGNPRSWQSICFSSGGLNPGFLGSPPPLQPLLPTTQNAYYDYNGFICNPRSRGGYSHAFNSTLRDQLDFNWGFFTDAPSNGFTATISGTTLTVTVAGTFPLIVGQQISGPGVAPGTMIIAQLTGPAQPTPGVAGTYIAGIGTYTLNTNYNGIGGNPAPILVPTAMTLNANVVSSGLSDPNSDLSTYCAFMDFQYQHLLNLRNMDPGNTYNYAKPAGIETVMAVPGMERWRQYSIIAPYAIAFSAHESGTMVMNNDPNKGAVDGNTRLHGTSNCFQADFSIFPVQNDGNPSLMIMPVAEIAAQQIAAVALN